MTATQVSFEILPEHANRDVSDVIRAHSRSFSIAARFLPSDIRANVERLYAWCRACDDKVDLASTPDEARDALQLLFEDLDLIEDGLVPKQASSFWLRDLVSDCGVEADHARCLLLGMKMDLEDIRIQDDRQLLDYAYHVAGVVGLMMCRVMRVNDSAADGPAVSLGIAMQLTNIARDVLEDAERNRSYLPGIDDPRTSDELAVKQAVSKVLSLADIHYAMAAKGLHFLPPSCRHSIAIAAALYREIGMEIRRQDLNVLPGRIVVPKWRLVNRILSLTMMKYVNHFKNKLSIKTSIPLNISNRFRPMEHQMNDARYVAYLGISVTAFMATGLFVMVYFIPKQTEYSWLPLLYAAISASVGIYTNLLVRRNQST